MLCCSVYNGAEPHYLQLTGSRHPRNSHNDHAEDDSVSSHSDSYSGNDDDEGYTTAGSSFSIGAFQSPTPITQTRYVALHWNQTIAVGR